MAKLLPKGKKKFRFETTAVIEARVIRCWALLSHFFFPLGIVEWLVTCEGQISSWEKKSLGLKPRPLGIVQWLLMKAKLRPKADD